MSKPNIKELRKNFDVEGLIEALRHSDWHVRADAAKVLGEIKDGRAVEPLMKALKDENAETRFNVAIALGWSFFGAARDLDKRAWAFDESMTKKVVESLVEAFVKDKDGNVRKATVFALSGIPIPMTLGQGERVVRRVEEVEGPIGLGFLLLTNQRLIYHGYTMTESFSLEIPLAEMVNCEVKSSLFGKKKLSVTARRAFYKDLSKLAIEEVATRGFSQPPASVLEPKALEFAGIKETEAFKSEIMGQVENYKRALRQ